MSVSLATMSERLANEDNQQHRTEMERNLEDLKLLLKNALRGMLAVEKLYLSIDICIQLYTLNDLNLSVINLLVIISI